MQEYIDIPIIVISGYPERADTTLKDIDTNRPFVKKTEANGRLIEEINRRI